MRYAILAALFCAASALQAADATLVGQDDVVQTRIGWGLNMSPALYITSGGYFRDSATTRVAVDTARTSVGNGGACSEDIQIRSGTGVVPQSYAQTSLRMRATDVAQAGIQVYLATRWKTSTDADTGWVVQARNRVWDTDSVRSTLTNPALTTSYATWWMNGFISGQWLRVCVIRTASGMGAGDTTVLNNNWLRAW